MGQPIESLQLPLSKGRVLLKGNKRMRSSRPQNTRAQDDSIKYLLFTSHGLSQFPTSTSLPDSRLTIHDSRYLPDSRFTVFTRLTTHDSRFTVFTRLTVLPNSPLPRFPVLIRLTTHDSRYLPGSLSLPTQQLNNSPTQHPLRIHDSRSLPTQHLLIDGILTSSGKTPDFSE